MKLDEIDLDFDLTSPEDLRRYSAAMERMRTAVQDLPVPPAEVVTEENFAAYTAFMEAQCRILTQFIDAAFGDGTCNRLLGPQTSVSKLNALCEDIGKALEAQGNATAKRLAPYQPNRRKRAVS